jgi:hypothetical protein
MIGGNVSSHLSGSPKETKRRWASWKNWVREELFRMTKYLRAIGLKRRRGTFSEDPTSTGTILGEADFVVGSSNSISKNRSDGSEKEVKIKLLYRI